MNVLCLCLAICLSWISVYCCICLGSFNMGESYDLKIINMYKQCRNKLRGLACCFGLCAMLTWLFALSALWLSLICLLWRGDGENRHLSLSVHAESFLPAKIKEHSLLKHQDIAQAASSDQNWTLVLVWWTHNVQFSAGHTWHWAQHSCLPALQNGTEDELNSASPLRRQRRAQLWHFLAGQQPSTPEGSKKQTGCAAHFSCCWGWTCPCTDSVTDTVSSAWAQLCALTAPNKAIFLSQPPPDRPALGADRQFSFT